MFFFAQFAFLCFQDDIFHVNTLLSVSLRSPYFKSGQVSEVFELVVLKNKEDGAMSLAIDEFPIMEEEALTNFVRQQTEVRRQEREVAIRLLEMEALLGKQYVQTIIEEKEKKASSLTETMDVLFDQLEDLWRSIEPTDRLEDVRRDGLGGKRWQVHPHWSPVMERLDGMAMKEWFRLTIAPDGRVERGETSEQNVMVQEAERRLDVVMKMLLERGESVEKDEL